MLSILGTTYGESLIQKVAKHNNLELEYENLRIGFGTLKATEVYIKPSNFPRIYFGNLNGRFNIFTGNSNLTSTTDSHNMFIYTHKKDNLKLWAGYISGQEFFDWFFADCNVSAEGRVEFNMTGTPTGAKTDNLFTAEELLINYKGKSRQFKNVTLHFSFDKEIGDIYELSSTGAISVNSSGIIHMDQDELINSTIDIKGNIKEQGISKPFIINGKANECPF